MAKFNLRPPRRRIPRYSTVSTPHHTYRNLLKDLTIMQAQQVWCSDLSRLVYRGTARNFNPMMAAAGKITIAEVEELVQPGELDPNQIHTPGIYVQRVFIGAHYEKRIEQRTVRVK